MDAVGKRSELKMQQKFNVQLTLSNVFHEFISNHSSELFGIFNCLLLTFRCINSFDAALKQSSYLP